jgi:DNA (cytosine-5)-methyltransferase 1
VRTLDIFCGAGGSSDGARSAGAEVVGGIDLDPVAMATWRDNFPGGVGLCERLETVSAATLRASFGRIDLLLASPECTNHSPAKGAAARCDRSRDTALLVVDYAKVLQPRWIVLENVVQMGPWRRFDELRAALDGLGYQTQTYVLNSADFGVAQSRRRLFLVADGERVPPSRIVPPPVVRADVRSILDPPERWPMSPLKTARRAVDTLKRAERATSELGPDATFLLVYYGTDGSGGWQTLDRPLRTVTTVDRFALVEPSQEGQRMRMLQPSELRRAMGLSDGFSLDHGSRRDRVRLLGNGVCAPVMTSIISQVTAENISQARTPTLHDTSFHACGSLRRDAQLGLDFENVELKFDNGEEMSYSALLRAAGGAYGGSGSSGGTVQTTG